MNKDAIAAAKSFCYMAFLSGQFSAAPPLFLLQGPAGTGKTYICNCIANEVLNKNSKMLKSVITVKSRKLEFQVRLIQAMTLKLRINHGSVLFQLIF